MKKSPGLLLRVARSAFIAAAVLCAAAVSLRAQDSIPDTTRAPRTQALPRVNVVDTLAPRSMSLAAQHGFYARRSHGLGTFVTDTQIAKHHYSDLAAVLSDVHGMHTVLDKGSYHPMLHGTLVGFCPPNIYVDGALFSRSTTLGGLNAPPAASAGGRGGATSQLAQSSSRGGISQSSSMDFADLSLIVQPDRIKGIEVYQNPGNAPIEFDLFSSTGCGSIVIWTR